MAKGALRVERNLRSICIDAPVMLIQKPNLLEKEGAGTLKRYPEIVSN